MNERPIARSHLQSHEETTAPSRAQAGGQPAAPSQRAAVGAGSRTHPPAGAAPARRHGAPIAAFRAAPSPAGLQTRSPGPERHRLPLPLSSSPRQHCPPPLSPEAVTVSPLSGDAPRRLGPGSQHRQQHQHQGAAPRGARGRPQPGGGTCNTHTALGRVGVPLLPPPPPRRSAPLTRRHGGQPEPRWMDALWLPRLLQPLSAQLCPPPPGKLQARGAHCPPRSSWQPYRAGNVPTAQ